MASLHNVFLFTRWIHLYIQGNMSIGISHYSHNSSSFHRNATSQMKFVSHSITIMLGYSSIVPIPLSFMWIDMKMERGGT